MKVVWFFLLQTDPSLLPRQEMLSLLAEIISTSADTIKGSRLQVHCLCLFNSSLIFTISLFCGHSLSSKLHLLASLNCAKRPVVETVVPQHYQLRFRFC